MTVHFVCRGNTYRSIIAEAYLKSLAISNLKVISSGTVGQKEQKNNELQFYKVQKLLASHGLEKYTKKHNGDQLDRRMLQQADLTIFINDLVKKESQEIGPLPIEYETWDILDINEGANHPKTQDEVRRLMEHTYNKIKQEVDGLVKRIKVIG